MKTQLWRVYLLICPDTNQIRYVGITSSSLRKRLRYHLKDQHNHEKASWIASLQRQGLTPIIQQIDTLSGTRREAEQLERRYIWFYLLAGCDLLNTEYMP